MFDSMLPISYYKEIATLNSEHEISIVQHIETKKVYIRKSLRTYNPDVYEQLYKHPVKNIPRIYAMYEAEGVLTIIEEYVSGETLQEILDMNVRISEKEAITYAIKTCNILSDLHNQDPAIVHRDVKPSNIILTEDERIVLIDLNAARQCSGEKQRDTRLIGTEGFAAPEQFGFGNSSPQTDIFAIGNLLKALLRSDDGSDTPITPKLAAVIRKCLEMNPKDRYNSAAQLAKNLEKCCRFGI